MTLRIRVPLPNSEEHLPFLIAAAGHLVLFLVIAGVIGPAGRTGRLPPALSVRLAPGQGRGGGQTATSRPPAVAQPRAARPTAPKLAEKPPIRTQAAPKPKQPSKEVRGATVQPDQLPQVAEPEPEGPASAAGNGAATAAAADGSIAGGVAGLAGGELGGGADWYVGLVVNRLQDAWRDRPVLPLGASPLRATVSFVIGRNGQVTDARIETPSGYAPLDGSVLRAVVSLGRLPPLPAVYRKDQLRAQFVFELTPPAGP